MTVTPIWYAINDQSLEDRQSQIESGRSDIQFPFPIMLDLTTGEFFPTSLRGEKDTDFNTYAKDQSLRIIGQFDSIQTLPQSDDIPNTGLIRIANPEGFIESAVEVAIESLGERQVQRIKDKIEGGAYYSDKFIPNFEAA